MGEREGELGADFSSIGLPSISVLTAGDVLCGLPWYALHILRSCIAHWLITCSQEESSQRQLPFTPQRFSLSPLASISPGIPISASSLAGLLLLVCWRIGSVGVMNGHTIFPLQFNGVGWLSCSLLYSSHQSLLGISSTREGWMKQKSC
jgi:hypothetical protein